MHYVIFSAQYPPFVGGIGSFVANLAYALAQAGERVTVVTSALGDEASGWKKLGERFSVLYLPTRAFMHGRLPLLKKNRETKKLLQELAESSPDRVLVNARFYQISLTGLQFAAKTNVPAVLLDHGAEPLTLNNRLLDRVLFAYERHMSKKCAAYHPRFAGISKASLRLLERFGIVAGTLVPNAIDAKRFRKIAEKRDFRAECNVSKNASVVAHISRLEPEKGTRYVLEAARNLPDTHFMFAGAGSLKEEVRAAASSIPNVHYMGELTEAGVSALLSQSDVLAFPTRSEGGGMVVLEAACQGTPVVATDTGHITEALPRPEWLQICKQDINSLVKGIKTLLSQEIDHEALRAHIEQNWNFEASVQALEQAFLPQQPLTDKTYEAEVLPRVQDALTDLLHVFDQTCKKLKLPYWIEAGTLLGARRHGGFIPWDDDIDVGLLEADWREFVAKAPAILPKGYKLLSQENTPGFSAFWVCLTNENTRFIDKDHFFATSEQGVYIDIFRFVPLDKRPLAAKVQKLRLRFWQGLSYLHQIPHVHRFFHALAKLVPLTTIKCCFEKAAHTKHPGDLLINPSYAGWTPIPYNVIFPTKPITFGKLEVEGPADPKRYLELEYGAWKEIPPPEMRHTHKPVILDLGDGVNVMGDSIPN